MAPIGGDEWVVVILSLPAAISRAPRPRSAVRVASGNSARVRKAAPKTSYREPVSQRANGSSSDFW